MYGIMTQTYITLHRIMSLAYTTLHDVPRYVPYPVNVPCYDFDESISKQKLFAVTKRHLRLSV